MSIVRKIKGKEVKVAEKSVIDHNQLANRDQYGAHSISAIRKLPEKLSKLKSLIDETSNDLSDEINRAKKAEQDLLDQIATEAATRLDADNLEAQTREQADTELNQSLSNEISRATIRENEIETNAQRINLRESGLNDGKLVFTDYNNNETIVQGGFLPDNDTIELNNQNQIKLKKIYVDNETIIGNGADAGVGKTISEKSIDDAQATDFSLDINKFIEWLKSKSIVLNVNDFIRLIINGEVGTSNISSVSIYTINGVTHEGISTTTPLEDFNLIVDDLLFTQSSEILNFRYIIDSNIIPLQAKAIKDTISGEEVTKNVQDIINIENDITNIENVTIPNLKNRIDNHDDEIERLDKEIQAIEGVGGYLLPHDFGTANPNLPEDDLSVEPKILSLLTQEALAQISTISEPQEI